MEHHGRRRLGAVSVLWALLVTVAVVALPAGQVLAITPDTTFEQCLLDKHNAARQAAGVVPLQTRSEMVSFARDHTVDMIEAGTLFHSSDLTKATTGWTKLGENVGRGSSCESLHNAFMNSPDHRANLLDPAYTSIGVGGARGHDDRMYVTVVFAAHKNATTTTSSTTTTTAPNPTTTTAAPKPTTTTTAPKPTTTTTAPKATTTTPATTTSTSMAAATTVVAETATVDDGLAPFLEGLGGPCAVFYPFLFVTPCTERTNQGAVVERRTLIM